MITINIPEEYTPQTQLFMGALMDAINNDETVRQPDAAALELLAYYHHNYILAKALLAEEGMVIRDKAGRAVKAHPAVKIAHDCEVKIFKTLKEFRLTPKSREKLPKTPEKSPFDNFMESVGITGGGVEIR